MSRKTVKPDPDEEPLPEPVWGEVDAAIECAICRQHPDKATGLIKPKPNLYCTDYHEVSIKKWQNLEALRRILEQVAKENPRLPPLKLPKQPKDYAAMFNDERFA